MTESSAEDSVAARAEELPGSGSPPAKRIQPEVLGKRVASYYAKGAQGIISDSAVVAAEILDKHVRRRRGWTTLPAGLFESCKFIIDHAIGRAKIKVEHSGAVLTYGEVSKSAENLAKKGRDILADAEAIKDGYAGSDGDSSPAATPPDPAPKQAAESTTKPPFTPPNQTAK